MHMTGEQRIAASRQRVWEALNDPEVLRQCIPGCQSLTKEADDRLAAVAEVKIGPIGARFKGVVTLSDLDPPIGYRIFGQGSGGVAGSAKGGATVRLRDQGGATVLTYDVEAQVGGRMAQLGGPLIDATAKQMAQKFFAKFEEVVAGETAAPVSAPVAVAAAPTPVAQSAPSQLASPRPLWGWICAVLAAMLAGYLLGLNRSGGGMVATVMALLVIVGGTAFEAGRRGGRR